MIRLPRPRRWLRAILASVVLVAAIIPARTETALRIVVVLSRDLAPYREALRGFTEVLDGSGHSYKIHEYSIDGVAAERGTLIGKIRSQHPDLILTVGSAATNLVSEEVSDLPIVFSMVLSSSGNRTLHQLKESRSNVTGASMEIPVRTQFTRLKELLPGVRRIGVLYNPELTGALIEEAALTALALDLELVPLAVTSETEVHRAAEALGRNVDVLWSVADSTVFSDQGLKHILLQTLRNRIPFVGLSPSFVKAGALFAFSTDYRDLGRQAGEQSLDILTGTHTSAIPMTVPRQLSLAINLNTAEQIRIQIEEEVRSNAQVFF